MIFDRIPSSNIRDWFYIEDFFPVGTFISSEIDGLENAVL